MRRLVLFDIDGTLLHSGGAGRRAIMAAMHNLLPAGDRYERIRFDGKTDPQIVSELLEAGGEPHPHDPDRVSRVLDRYVGLLARELDAGTRRSEAMPGIPALLDALEQDDRIVLGLLTGNVAAGAALKLAAAGIAPGRFQVGAYGSDSAHRPELPPIAARRAEPWFGRIPAGAEVVIIGDTPADVTCGAGIGARAIAVATGGFTLPELSAHDPWRAFEDLSDTAAAVEAILDGLAA